MRISSLENFVRQILYLFHILCWNFYSYLLKIWAVYFSSQRDLEFMHAKYKLTCYFLFLQEMNLLVEADQPGNQLDDYVFRLNAILSQKAEGILQLQSRLAQFQRHLKEHNVLVSKTWLKCISSSQDIADSYWWKQVCLWKNLTAGNVLYCSLEVQELENYFKVFLGLLLYLYDIRNQWAPQLISWSGVWNTSWGQYTLSTMNICFPLPRLLVGENGEGKQWIYMVVTCEPWGMACKKSAAIYCSDKELVTFLIKWIELVSVQFKLAAYSTNITSIIKRKHVSKFYIMSCRSNFTKDDIKSCWRCFWCNL